MYRKLRGHRLPHHRARYASRQHGLLAVEPSAGLVSQVLHGYEDNGRVDTYYRVAQLSGGFYKYYLIGVNPEHDGADDEPDRERELKEEYDPPHSPFGRIYALVSSRAFTYDEVMTRIPWCVVLAMINDQGRMRKKQEEEQVIDNEQEELEFLGLA